MEQETFDETLESLLALLRLMLKERYQEHQDTSHTMSAFIRKLWDLYLVLSHEPILLKDEKYQDYLNESSVLLTWLPVEFHRFMSGIEDTLASTFYNDEWLWICWRRSALEALKEMYIDTCFGENLPVLEDEDLDDRIKAVGEVEGYLSNQKIPSGIPHTHWWWYSEQPRISSMHNK